MLTDNAVPMTENKKQNLKTGEKLLFIVAGAFLILASIAFGIMQYMMATHDKPIFEQYTTFDLSEAGHRGSEIYRHSACSECHRAMSEGTNMGNSLDGTGSRRTVAWLEQFLKDPEAVYGHVTMDHGNAPKQASYISNFSDAEIHDLAVFLSELKSKQGSSSSPVPPKGESPFIDSMVKTWAPTEWKSKYKDIRDQYSESATGEKE